MMLRYVILGLMWLGYGIIHSVLATAKVKSYIQDSMGASAKHYRLLYTLLAFVLLVLVLLYQVSLPNEYLFTPTIWSRIMGGIVAFAGLLLMLVCIKKYFMSLSGLRSILHEYTGSELIVSGVHRFVRHPLYLGTFMFLWGLFVIYPYVSLLIMDIVITAYTLIAIRYEEAKLLKQFGSKYRIYMTEVPMIIPSSRPHPSPTGE